MRTLATLLLLAAFAHAAPAPIPKPRPTHQLVGSWNLVWGLDSAGVSPVTFDKDGSFGCYYGNELWTGTWSLEGDVLSVQEARTDGHRIRWSVLLEPPARGRRGGSGVLHGGGGKFVLRPAE